MTLPILATKLYIPPPRPKVVARPHLIERLHGGLHGKLTLVSAPAGFGKSTLVSEWLATLTATGERPAAWLSLDEGDSDPNRFLMYLVAALQTLGQPQGQTGAPKLGEGVLRAILSPQPPPLEANLTTLINEIATLPHPYILVLDDYHALDSPTVDQALTFLLDHLPPQMHLVITTREDPQLPLARLRARGHMSELRASDLRFTSAEAAAFLNQVMGLTLTAEEVNALETRTEGWIAGLQLAALSMRGRADVARFVHAFAGDNRYIVDYLVEEVLQRQPAPVRSFLLQTSILARLCGPLCDAVSGEPNGMALLDALERNNLFVVPLDDNRQWFRYHHLFAGVLAVRARQEQPDQVPIWHQRASAWYAEHGMTAEAIRHALAANDFTRAAALIELAWPQMDGLFQTGIWLGWAKALPDELLRARPVLMLSYGWALLNAGELEAAEARLLDAERLLQAAADEGVTEGTSALVVVDEEQFRTLPASLATARAYLTQANGDLPASVAYGRQALELLPQGDDLRRGPAAALLGLAQWASGDLEAAYRTLADAMAGFERAGNLHFAISVTSGLVDIRLTQGRLADAIKVYTQALQLVSGEALMRGTANLHLGLSDLYREQGEWETALHHLQRGAEVGEQGGLLDWRYRFLRVQARFKESQSDLAGALDLLDVAEGHFYRTPVPDVRPLAAMRARLWVAQGRLQEALHWVQETGLAVDDELSFLREFEHITLARVLLAVAGGDAADFASSGASGEALNEAMFFLDRLQQAAEAGGRMGSVIEIAFLQAHAHQAQGDGPRALDALSRALKLAEPQGYLRTFADRLFAGSSTARLISFAASQGLLPAFVGKALNALAAAEDDALLAAGAQPSPVNRDLVGHAPRMDALIEPLSARELDILGLIAQGLSNGEIGARLFLALSTVKGHNRNIFDKLQVQSRTEAVARARTLGLL